MSYNNKGEIVIILNTFELYISYFNYIVNSFKKLDLNMFLGIKIKNES